MIIYQAHLNPHSRLAFLLYLKTNVQAVDMLHEKLHKYIH